MPKREIEREREREKNEKNEKDNANHENQISHSDQDRCFASNDMHNFATFSTSSLR